MVDGKRVLLWKKLEKLVGEGPINLNYYRELRKILESEIGETEDLSDVEVTKLSHLELEEAENNGEKSEIKDFYRNKDQFLILRGDRILCRINYEPKNNMGPYSQITDVHSP